MPTYEYACTACSERLEVVQRFTDAALTECPACGGALRKVFSPVGIVFKGSGFYKNDSRAKTSSAGGDTKSGDTKSGESKSGDSTTSGPKTGDAGKAPAKTGTPSAAPGAGSSGGGAAPAASAAS